MKKLCIASKNKKADLPSQIRLNDNFYLLFAVYCEFRDKIIILNPEGVVSYIKLDL